MNKEASFWRPFEQTFGPRVAETSCFLKLLSMFLAKNFGSACLATVATYHLMQLITLHHLIFYEKLNRHQKLQNVTYKSFIGIKWYLKRILIIIVIIIININYYIIAIKFYYFIYFNYYYSL